MNKNLLIPFDFLVKIMPVLVSSVECGTEFRVEDLFGQHWSGIGNDQQKKDLGSALMDYVKTIPSIAEPILPKKPAQWYKKI